MNSTLTYWDWTFLVWFLLVSAWVGLAYAKKAGNNLSEFFLSGRNLPGWALGTSIVATTFAADTPLVVSGLVISKGIAGNWLWWNFIIGGTLTVFLFSRLWRRSRVVTEIELIAKRYSGKPAHFLRGFKAIYLGLLVNSIIFGWVTKAMGQILEVVFGVSPLVSLAVLIGLTFIYTTSSGLWGAVATDVLQFAVAMIGSIIMAVLSVQKVGGLSALIEQIQSIELATGRHLLNMVPTAGEAFMYVVLVLVCVNWWAVYYPGAEPGGGGWTAQRMLAAKDENHARSGALWFTVAHYCVRPWPWILVGLCALVLEPKFLNPELYGDAFKAEKAYPWMFHVLPTGLLGLVVASFLAAYMSTITSILNLSASYLVNDFYLPYFSKNQHSDQNQVRLARLTTATVTLIGCLISWALESAGSGWQFIMEFTAGTGLVLLLRWVWWRVNAWSEISAMIASTILCLALSTSAGKSLLAKIAGDNPEMFDPVRLMIVVLGTTAVFLLVTFKSRPVEEKHLQAFYNEVQPSGWWGAFAKKAPQTSSTVSDLKMWGLSTVFVFALLFGCGALVLQQYRLFLILLCAAGASGGVLFPMMMRKEGALAR